ncbi:MULTISPECIES: hypothetical protein [unclassified Mammaliicoccus]|nr:MULTISPECIES: hypothetical protein [unclassified Mammaliicoccus]
MPSTNRKGVPQSKEEISDLISESADTYSEELSVRMSDERNTAEQPQTSNKSMVVKS